MSMNELHPRVEAILSISRALWGQVTPELRAVFGQLGPKSLNVTMIFEGEITDDLREIASEVETYVIADYPDVFTITVDAVRLDPPPRSKTIIPPDADWSNIVWVYERREPDLDG